MDRDAFTARQASLAGWNTQTQATRIARDEVHAFVLEVEERNRQLRQSFSVDASTADTVVITLNRAQAAKIGEVLHLCTDDSTLRLDWDEPETADLVRDFARDTVKVLGRPETS